MIRFDLAGRVAVVTGGSRGIGRGIVEKLAGAGAEVAVWDLRPPPDGAAAPGSPAMTRAVDVSDPDSVAGAVAATLERLGRIDVLVNNAGVNGPTVPTWEYPVEDWHRVLATDLTGVFLCCRAVAPSMRARGYGRIVNVASVAGKEGNANICAYAAAKAGVIALTKSLAKELARDGVLVNCVTPAMVETDLLREMTPEYIADIRARMPMGRLGSVEENANMVAWLCSDECSFSTGAAFDVSGGRATY